VDHPVELPERTFAYKVVATDLDGNSQTWNPSNGAPRNWPWLLARSEIKKQ